MSIFNESILGRPRPSTPYRSSGLVMQASDVLLKETLTMLRSVPNRESACFWLGDFDTNLNAHAHALVIPKQINNPLNYSISALAMQEVAAYARPHGWTVVASIHSHPGKSVEHSTYDDEMSPSRRALSIVFPIYGLWKETWPNGIGVHEFINNYWHLLPEKDAKNRVVFNNDLNIQIVDLR